MKNFFYLSRLSKTQSDPQREFTRRNLDDDRYDDIFDFPFPNDRLSDNAQRRFEHIMSLGEGEVPGYEGDGRSYLENIEENGRVAELFLTRAAMRDRYAESGRYTPEELDRYYGTADQFSRPEIEKAQRDYAHWVQMVHDGLDIPEVRRRYRFTNDRPAHLQFEDPGNASIPWPEDRNTWSHDLHNMDEHVRNVLREHNEEEFPEEYFPDEDRDYDEDSDSDYDINSRHRDEFAEIQRQRQREEGRRIYESVPEEQRNVEDSFGETPWDSYQRMSQDYYSAGVAKLGRAIETLGLKDGIYSTRKLIDQIPNLEREHARRLSIGVPYFGKFGPYCFSFTGYPEHDEVQETHDKRWGIHWEIPQNPNPYGPSMSPTRLGERAPTKTFAGNCSIGSLVQFRDKTPEEQNVSFRSFGTQIAEHLFPLGFSRISFGAADSSRTIAGRAIGQRSRSRLFDAIIDSAQKKLKKIHGDALGVDTVTERTKTGKVVRYPSAEGVDNMTYYGNPVNSNPEYNRQRGVHQMFRQPNIASGTSRYVPSPEAPDTSIDIGAGARYKTALDMESRRSSSMPEQVRANLDLQRKPQHFQSMDPVMERSQTPFPLQLRLVKADPATPLEHKVVKDVAKVRDEEEDDAVGRMRQQHHRYVRAVSDAMNDAAKDILSEVHGIESNFERKISREEKKEDRQGIKNHADAHEKNHGSSRHSQEVRNAIKDARSQEKKERVQEMGDWYKIKEQHAIQGMRQNKKKDMDQAVDIVREARKHQ